MTIPEMLANFQSLRLREEVPRIIERTGKQMLDLNKKQLFEQSADSDEIELPGYKSFSYAEKKYKMNPLPGFDHPDLYYSGDFQNGFYLEVKSDSYLIYSKDDKVDNLVAKYDDNIFGLNPTSKEQYVNETIYPSIAAYIKAKTGLILG